MGSRISQCLALIPSTANNRSLHYYYCPHWHIRTAERLLRLVQRLAHALFVG
jgi:hypothetical protein